MYTRGLRLPEPAEYITTAYDNGYFHTHITDIFNLGADLRHGFGRQPESLIAQQSFA